MDRSGALEKQSVADLHDVGFVENRDFVVLPTVRIAEGPARDAGASRVGGHLHAHDHVIGHLVLYAAVESLRVFADDHQIDVLEACGNAFETADGSNGCIEIQLFPQLDIHRSESLPHRGCAWALESDAGTANRIERFRRHEVFA